MMTAIVIPTYNEKENLPILAQRIFALNLPDVYLIVVDDNSPDGTGDVAEGLVKEYGKIHVLHRQVRGRATAGLDGFRLALKMGADFIVEMDADLSHDPNDIPRFLEAIRSTDVVVGSRYSGGVIENRSWFRNRLSDVINFFNRWFLGLKIRDISGGYKCYRREVLASLNFDRFVSTGYSIGAELLYRISKNKFKMVEIPIHFHNRIHGYSKCDLRQMVNYGFKLVQIRFFM
ncbi:MAG: polyprenol monophosphomannose synthase [Deltaproteobacteria bacterium]|nr:polyprenol monophosphomannose synthase [Deltaproteobacteria bacterium]